MTNAEFEHQYYPKYKGAIEAIARKFARDDHDLFDDMVSVGTMGLLEAEPSRAGTNVDAYLRNVVRNKIVDHLRWLNRRDMVRLNGETSDVNGYDLVREDPTGEAELVPIGSRPVIPKTLDPHHPWYTPARTLWNDDVDD